MSQAAFYDEIAEYYDLIYADWEGSMERHGFAISQMLQRGGAECASTTRILDVCSGIGTQVLPLASLGYEVTARDLSGGSIARLDREASARNLTIDSAQSDLRRVGETVDGEFDAVLAFDNSIPHLLTDAEIEVAFRHLSNLLKPSGQLLISVRDYDRVDRNPTSYHPYGEHTRSGRSLRLGQEWVWTDPSHYRTTMVVEERLSGEWIEIVRTEAEYYVVPIGRLLKLMEGAGLQARIVEDVPFFQPVLCGSAV